VGDQLGLIFSQCGFSGGIELFRESNHFRNTFFGMTNQTDTVPERKFQLLGGHLVLDFINTLDNRGAPHQKELLSSYGALIAFLQQTQALTEEEARELKQRAAEQYDQAGLVLTYVQGLRESLYEVLAAHIEERTIPEDRLAFVSSLWREAAEQRTIVAGANRDFQWGWLRTDTKRYAPGHRKYSHGMDEVKAPLWRLAMAAGEFLVSKEMANMRRCADTTCNWLFLDKTKSHTRRWCEMRVCGNRDKARRFYRKHKAQ
jgi:predicted RNA-binding Zn ribbon-like protein